MRWLSTRDDRRSARRQGLGLAAADPGGYSCAAGNLSAPPHVWEPDAARLVLSVLLGRYCFKKRARTCYDWTRAHVLSPMVITFASGSKDSQQSSVRDTLSGLHFFALCSSCSACEITRNKGVAIN